MPDKSVKERIHAGEIITGRSLYTSWEGASLNYEEADKLHREQAAWINPRDAEAAGVRDGDEVELTNDLGTVRIAVRLDDGVDAGTVYVPQYYDGGAVLALFGLDGLAGGVAPVRIGALQPA